MNPFILLLQVGGNSTAAFLVQVLPIAAIFLVFYFLVIAPANKQKRKTRSRRHLRRDLRDDSRC